MAVEIAEEPSAAHALAGTELSIRTGDEHYPIKREKNLRVLSAAMFCRAETATSQFVF